MLINKEQLLEVLEMQKVLDADVLAQKGLEWEDTMLHRVIAAMVELGEFANEQRFFKFWSVKPASDRAICLDEYVDVLHFIASLCNFAGINFEEYAFEEVGIAVEDNEKREGAFAYMMMRLVALFEGIGYESAFLLFDAFFAMGDIYEYTWDEVYAAYIAKNKVNFERLASGY